MQILVENDEKLELRNQQQLLGDASAWERSRKKIAVIVLWHALARYIIIYYNSTFRAFRINILTTFCSLGAIINYIISQARCK